MVLVLYARTRRCPSGPAAGLSPQSTNSPFSLSMTVPGTTVPVCYGVRCLSGGGVESCVVVVVAGAGLVASAFPLRDPAGASDRTRHAPVTLDDVAGRGQVGDDAVGAAFGDAPAGRDVAQAPPGRGRCAAAPGRGWPGRSRSPSSA
jgi:hypothetical protein